MHMPIINFDDHFAEYMSAWMKDHEDQYENYDEMEEDLPKIYLSFLNTRASWLGSVSPGSYFTQFEDPKVLVDWMNQYCAEGVPLPEPLLEQIVFVGKPCEKRLTALLQDEEADRVAKMTAVELLREMDSSVPKMLYIRWQLNREEKDELKDNAVESLCIMGPEVVQPILQSFDQANDAGQEAFMEVLVHYPVQEKVFQTVLDFFNRKKDKRALFAGYLAKIGDDRALPDLIRAAGETDLPYLTFIEIRNAIETLGGNCPEREYADDPEYEALRQMDLT